MDLIDTPELAEYRSKVRAWLEANKAPAPFRRAQLSRLLLGGRTEAGQRVVSHVLG